MTGNYQLALVFTRRGGDALQIRDWYNGFAGLTSFGRLKISSGMPGSEASDVDGDGLIDKPAKDSKVEATGTVSVCAEEGALTRRVETSSPSATIELKPAMSQVLKVFAELKITTDTYYAETGQFPLTFEEISPYLASETQSLVAHIQLNSKEPFSYQFTLKDDLEPAIAGKTVQFVYESTTQMWFCRSGHENGLDSQYLPLGCRN